MRKGPAGLTYILCLLCFAVYDLSPQVANTQNAPQEKSSEKEQLQVNWIYGAYLRKGSILIALTNHERLVLYARQTYTTPGISAKSALFSAADHLSDSPPQWNGEIKGYGQRLASRHGQFVIQNTLTSLGNGLLGYEPRYDRCNCSGFWDRTGHAVLRNFVTYNSTEKSMRPQLASYAAALAAGAISSTWKPESEPWHEAYRSVITQAAFGVCANWLGEFAPEIGRLIRKDKKDASLNMEIPER